jgi:WhiB family transcriptional regulator, redox-sensing transcriptional regulator
MIKPQGWKNHGLCREVGGDAWYPETSDDSRAARRICAACPVQTTCRAAGWNEPYGIWGGLTEDDRRKAKRHARTTNTAA